MNQYFNFKVSVVILVSIDANSIYNFWRLKLRYILNSYDAYPASKNVLKKYCKYVKSSVFFVDRGGVRLYNT